MSASIIGQFLQLLHPTDGVFEVRAPKCPDRPGVGTYRSTHSGYFETSHMEAAALAVAALDRDHQPAGIYVTLNPGNPALLARAANRVKTGAQATTGDNDIACRRWLFVDIDPKRPAEISSTETEQQAAIELARHVYRQLNADGWPAPVVCLSGNGAYLLYRLDNLPNDETSTALVRGVLEGLAKRFNTAEVEIDRATFNAARIIKIMGTHARKGDSIPERPHRLAKILSRPEGAPHPVSMELLRALVPVKESVSTSTPRSAGESGRRASFERVESTPAAVQAYLERHGVRVLREQADGAYTQLVLDHCPIAGSAGEGGTSVTVRISTAGVISYHNLHASARGSAETWIDLREYFEPGYRDFVERVRARPPAGGTPVRDTLPVGAAAAPREGESSDDLSGTPPASVTTQTIRAGLDTLLLELPTHHGRQFVGLPTGRFPTLDDRLCGIRGLIVTAAAPGIGKTSLGLNLGLAAVQYGARPARHPSEAVVFVFFSFEMSRRSMELRLLTQTTGLSWRRLVLGQPGCPPGADGLRLSAEDRLRFALGVEELQLHQDCIVIVDRREAADGIARPAAWLTARIDAAKVATGAARAFVLVDSLQTMPVYVDPTGQPWRTVLEAERYAMAELQAVASRYPDDPVFVISEQAKAGMGGTHMVSVLGSGRALYSPDVLMFLRTEDDDLESDRSSAVVTAESTATEVDLCIRKARDGMRHGVVPLTFHHRTCHFEESARRPFAASPASGRHGR